MLWKPSRKKPIAKTIRAICSQKMRRRISGPKARRARAAEVATSTKVHKGRAQANKAMAAGRRAASSGAAEKMRGDRAALSVMSSGDQRGGADRDEQRELDRAVGVLLAVPGRHHPLQRAGHRKIDDVGDQAHRAPEHDIEP